MTGDDGGSDSLRREQVAPSLAGLLASVHVSGRAKTVESILKKVMTDPHHIMAR